MHRLYVVQSSHPCEAVKRALELKAMPYRTVELLIPTHAVIMRLLFPARTVPALRLDGGEKLQGSRAILRRLDELVAEPPLLPAGEAERAAVLEAERWGEETLQPLARRVTWSALKRRPDAIASYQEASELPRMPGPVVRLVAPAVIRVETAMNRAGDAAVRADLATLPAHIERVDAWIADGVLGGASPNAADLQIGASLRVLATLGDVRPLLAGRAAEALAMRLFCDFAGDVPAGAYPAGWVPERTSAAA